MSEEKKSPEVARQSSPRFPFIPLAKALERTEQLRKAASFGFAPVPDVRKVWGYGPKSSGGDQTLAALGYYGLIEEAGTGNERRVKISDLGARYLRDERPEIQRALQEQMVQAPKAMQTLWDLWKQDIPSDGIARSILKNDLGFSDSAAAQILGVYRDNLQYFPVQISGGALGSTSGSREKSDDQNPNSGGDGRAKVGDFIQWSPGGVSQFDKPQKVAWVDKAAGFLRVGGSATGIPLAETIVVEAPIDERGSRGTAQSDDDFTVLMSGKKLQITAEVDLAGLSRLKAILEKYEEILKLMQAP